MDEGDRGKRRGPSLEDDSCKILNLAFYPVFFNVSTKNKICNQQENVLQK